MIDEVFSENVLAPTMYSFEATDNAEFCQNVLNKDGLADDFFVNVATNQKIQLDFDIPYESNLPPQFFWVLDVFRRTLINGREASYKRLKSRNGRTHIVITLSWEMGQPERIAWQAAFGSDFKREALALTYAALGQKSPLLLYSRKVEESVSIPIEPNVH